MYEKWHKVTPFDGITGFLNFVHLAFSKEHNVSYTESVSVLT
jgi:hypothetical protein